MKKSLLLFAVLLLFAGNAAAQDWKELLKKAATAALDKATDGQLTRYALVGTWNYTAPGVKFEGEDWASELGGTALESTVRTKLESVYSLAGIKPGSCCFAFDNEAGFTAVFGTRTLTGTYEFDAATHAVTLRFTKGTCNLGTVEGYAYVSGPELQLVFPVTKLVKMISALGSKISSLSALSKLLDKYENVYIGFGFVREE